MKTDPQDPLARWAGNTLRQLPGRPAPAALRTAVLAEIQRRAERPWYQRPWLEWPLAAQIGSVGVLTGGALAGYFMGMPWIQGVVAGSGVAQEAAATYQTASAFGDAAGAIGRSGSRVLARVPTATWLALAAAAATVWLSMVGLGTAAWRVARAQHGELFAR
jgi:hypothetical protein